MPSSDQSLAEPERFSARSKIHSLIAREGPISFDRYMEIALYDDQVGFFAQGHGAGRAGRDFITSPEVGSLFGVLVGRALDQWWFTLGQPDPFFVIEAGAGRGQLARDVLRAQPMCVRALRYVLVERSAALRAQHRDHLPVEDASQLLGPVQWADDEDGETIAAVVVGTGPKVASLEDLPSGSFTGVILANELLDNLPFRIATKQPTAWAEVRVGASLGATGATGDDQAGPQLIESLVPVPPDLVPHEVDAADLPEGACVPIQTAASEWIVRAAERLQRGALIVIDYAAPIHELADRGRGWLRTYAAHHRGESPLAAPGEHDITADVALETVRRAAGRARLTPVIEMTQAEWLQQLWIDDLVEEARRGWSTRIGQPDLEALKQRSWIGEAAALTDPTGLGAHTVLVWSKGIA